ncbi:unnamed protein product [Sphagnum balticum]
MPTDKAAAAAAGVLFCCKQEGSVNHEAMKIDHHNRSGRHQKRPKQEKKKVAYKRPKAKPTRPTGRTPMMMMKPPAFRFPGLAALHVSSELALQSSS